MSTSCSCLRMCSTLVALVNLGFGCLILARGIITFKEYFENKATIGYVIVFFQISSFLLIVGVILLVGIIKLREKLISLYLVLSSLIWFIITLLLVMYMLYYNTTTMVVLEPDLNETEITTTTTTTVAPDVSTTPAPKESVPASEAVGFSLGIVLIWLGQLSVYKFHDQVIEKNVIDAGESYVNSAIHSN